MLFGFVEDLLQIPAAVLDSPYGKGRARPVHPGCTVHQQRPIGRITRAILVPETAIELEQAAVDLVAWRGVSTDLNHP